MPRRVLAVSILLDYILFQRPPERLVSDYFQHPSVLEREESSSMQLFSSYNYQLTQSILFAKIFLEKRFFQPKPRETESSLSRAISATFSGSNKISSAIIRLMRLITSFLSSG